MCTDTICSAFLATLVVLNLVFSLSTFIIVASDGDESTLSQIISLSQSQVTLETISRIADISHVPSKPYEFFDRPGAGDCCDGLCIGDTCTISVTTLLTAHHCNKCCFQLVEAGSCTDTTCRCYANNQEDTITIV